MIDAQGARKLAEFFNSSVMNTDKNALSMSMCRILRKIEMQAREGEFSVGYVFSQNEMRFANSIIKGLESDGFLVKIYHSQPAELSISF